MLRLLIALCLCHLGYAEGPLIVSYATTHLGGMAESITGQLITPSGETLSTGPMGPFEHRAIILNLFEEGVYEAYFEVLAPGALRMCPIVGGIVPMFTHHPEQAIPLTPQESLIQTFPPGRRIEVGSTTQPRCTFRID